MTGKNVYNHSDLAGSLSTAELVRCLACGLDGFQHSSKNRRLDAAHSQNVAENTGLLCLIKFSNST